jgi:phage shock protein E
MKHKNLLTAAAVLTVFFLIGCGAKEPSSDEEKIAESTVHVISAEEAKKMMDEEEVIIVDVRTKEEFLDEHIEGAVLLTLDTISEKAEEVLSDKNETYLIYCRSGSRSNQAARELVAMGYQEIYDFGGIIDWDYETVSGEN